MNSPVRAGHRTPRRVPSSLQRLSGRRPPLMVASPPSPPEAGVENRRTESWLRWRMQRERWRAQSRAAAVARARARTARARDRLAVRYAACKRLNDYRRRLHAAPEPERS